MIATSIKNFFKSIGFYFIPLGVMSFFTIIYIAWLIPSMIEVVQNSFQAIADKIGSTTFNWDDVLPSLMAKGMEYADPTALLGLITNPNGIIDLLKETAMETFGLETITNDIMEIINGAVTQLTVMLVGVLAVVIISFVIGFIVLEVLMRKYLTNINIFKSILASLVNAIIFGLILWLVFMLYIDLATWVAILGSIIAMIIAIFFSLLEAYLFYGVKKVRFKQVVNIKNVLYLIIGGLIDIVICAGICALCLLIKDKFIAIFIMVPFVEITLCVLEINADGYVAKLAGEAKIEKKIEERIQDKKED